MRSFSINLALCGLVLLVACRQQTENTNKTVSLEKTVYTDTLALGTRAEGQAPVLKYLTSNVFEFGEISEGEVIKKTFEFSNIGNYPLAIIDYDASCNCTDLVLNKSLIMPGDTAQIVMTYNSKGKSGIVRVNARLVRNTAQKYNLFSLKGIVK